MQALETLAVIAYRQPMTALEITEIRGVNTSGVLTTLLERHLIKIVGRKQVVGRPFLYATTKEFLIRFGLNDLTDLPKVEDMAEALGIDAPILVEQTPSEEALPLEEPDAAGDFDEDDPRAANQAGRCTEARRASDGPARSECATWRADSSVCADARSFFTSSAVSSRHCPASAGCRGSARSRRARGGRPGGRSRRTSSGPDGCAPRER